MEGDPVMPEKASSDFATKAAGGACGVQSERKAPLLQQQLWLVSMGRGRQQGIARGRPGHEPLCPRAEQVSRGRMG